MIKHFCFNLLFVVFLQLNSQFSYNLWVILIIQNFMPIFFPDKISFAYCYSFVNEKCSFVICYTICSNNIFSVTFRQINTFIVNAITNDVGSRHKKDNFTKFIKFFYKFDICFFFSRLQSLKNL